MANLKAHETGNGGSSQSQVETQGNSPFLAPTIESMKGRLIEKEKTLLERIIVVKIELSIKQELRLLTERMYIFLIFDRALV